MDKLGEITVGKGTPRERKIDVIDFIQSNDMLGQRVVTIMEIADGSFAIDLKSKPEDEHVHQYMWLTKESLIDIIGYSLLLLGDQLDFDKEFAKLHKTEKVNQEIPFMASEKLIKKLNADVYDSENES